jgi:hypothetical protein
MWIFCTIGCFSIVTDSTKRGWLSIRARARADINNLYREHRQACPSMTPPSSDEARDYRYRLSISRKDWIKLVGKLTEEVDYPNFKMAVHERADQANKHAAYAEIWWTMRRIQLDEPEPDHPPKRKSRKRRRPLY